ncbi:hypothetical protein JRQ81_001319 [Phrynocephalus forsythii]|uniref:Uncharacterized protein n=1 Tax=Phrynocephalus forsythii TaxID=171643 RepID=A0A9Q0YAH2_9SAUR|nr:hypothetical protein JRQ81_001319 [Phrynocephalus forsythii]
MTLTPTLPPATAVTDADLAADTDPRLIGVNDIRLHPPTARLLHRPVSIDRNRVTSMPSTPPMLGVLLLSSPSYKGMAPLQTALSTSTALLPSTAPSTPNALPIWGTPTSRPLGKSRDLTPLLDAENDVDVPLRPLILPELTPLLDVDPPDRSTAINHPAVGSSATSEVARGPRPNKPPPLSLQPSATAPSHQHLESPTSMDELPPELSDEGDSEEDDASYCSEASSSHNVPLPKTDILGSQPPSLTEDMKLYSQTIHKIASVMELQVQQDQTADSCRFFGHLNRRQTPPLRLAFIPSLLDRIKEAWNKPSSAPLMSCRVDNMYRTHGNGTSFLDRHPLPNSLVVDATQTRTRGRSALTPSNKEGWKLDIIGRRHYSLASFSLHSANYLCAMEAYSRHILLQAAPVLDSLPEEQKAKLSALHEELISLIDFETLAARNMADAAAKQLSNAVYLQRHAWLRTTNIPDDARNRIEDSPFDGGGFLRPQRMSLSTLSSKCGRPRSQLPILLHSHRASTGDSNNTLGKGRTHHLSAEIPGASDRAINPTLTAKITKAHSADLNPLGAMTGTGVIRRQLPSDEMRDLS